jgi:hypothetical protein
MNHSISALFVVLIKAFYAKILNRISIGRRRFLKKNYVSNERHLIREAQAASFDRDHNIDTSGIIDWNDLGFDSLGNKYVTKYQGINPEAFNSVLGELPISYTEYEFIDFGSGKGRALFLASLFPFKKIIGIELSEYLHDCAIKNIQTFDSIHQSCSNISLECADATNYELSGDSAVLHFYNPYGSELMRTTIHNIEKSIRLQRRSIFIVYFNPVHKEVIDESKFFKPYSVTQSNLEKVAVWVAK